MRQLLASAFRWAVVTAALVLAPLQILGALQVREHAYRGYRTTTDQVVAEVSAGGPAAHAGLRVGDRIMRIDGVDAGDRRALDAQPRARIGQTQVVVADRRGQPVELRLTLAGLPRLDTLAYLGSVLTGLSFVVFGLWACLRIPRRTTRLLAWVGVGVGAIFTEMPYFASPLARALQESGLIAAGVLGFAALLHFMLVFPKEAGVLRRKAVLPAIYLPAALVSVAQVAATGWQGPGAGGAAPLMTTLSLVLVLVYFLLAVIALVRGYRAATKAERSAWGLSALIGSLLLGLAPMIPTAVALVAPAVVFPGSEYYDLTWVLIPFALARAAILHARGTPETAVSA